MATNHSFKHSGTLGDLIYSLPIVRYLNGGKFYLHLNQVDWIGKYYYGADPNPFHQGRMTMQDFNFMESFMKAQDYIESFQPLDPRTVEITHNLDRFRAPFVGHPGNYVDLYANVFGLADPTLQQMLRQTIPIKNVYLLDYHKSTKHSRNSAVGTLIISLQKPYWK